MEASHSAQNIQPGAAGLGPGFSADGGMRRIIGLDKDEITLYLRIVGEPGQRP